MAYDGEDFGDEPTGFGVFVISDPKEVWAVEMDCLRLGVSAATLKACADLSTEDLRIVVAYNGERLVGAWPLRLAGRLVKQIAEPIIPGDFSFSAAAAVLREMYIQAGELGAALDLEEVPAGSLLRLLITDGEGRFHRQTAKGFIIATGPGGRYAVLLSALRPTG